METTYIDEIDHGNIIANRTFAVGETVRVHKSIYINDGNFAGKVTHVTNTRVTVQITHELEVLGGTLSTRRALEDVRFITFSVRRDGTYRMGPMRGRIGNHGAVICDVYTL